MSIIKNLEYEYRNLPIPGGGYVTGFVFHTKQPGILYARTDIGGTYRFDYDTRTWISLIDHVSMFDLSESYPIALALDDQAPEKLYIASGVNEEGRNGVLSISNDYGNTFTYEEIPCFVHGNWNGRGTGLRLIVDPKDSNILYFASQRDGLLRTKDLGKTWEILNVMKEKYMTFVWVSPVNGAIIVGTAGVTTKISDTMRGTGLCISYDGGNTFEELTQPKSHKVLDSRMSGYVAQRYDFDGTYLYVTLANTGAHSYVIENGYSCDSGDTLGGKVLRYFFDETGKIAGYDDITPTEYVQITEGVHNNESIHSKELLSFNKEEDYEFGFSGISSCQSEPGLLICTTICKADGDIIYLSKDYGNTWSIALYDLEIGNLTFRAPYMSPECNGGHSLLHWLSDMKINPFQKDEAWFNSGTGVFLTENLTSDDRSFCDHCDGIEETVHLNLYSPPAGDVQLIDILGDLGGFAFTDLNTPCGNSFADADGNRYITCINADYPDQDCDYVVVTPRGNWTGKTKGGLILTKDQCKTFTRLPMPYGLTSYIDEKCSEIEHPNVNSGWVSVGADKKTIVWSIANNIDLPKSSIVVTHDEGISYEKCVIYDLQGNRTEEGKMKVFSDRVNPELFYGFGSDTEVFVSKDRGHTFYQYETPKEVPAIEFGLIDCANKTEVRGNSGFEGEFYIAMNIAGLWKFTYNKEADSIEWKKLSEEGDVVYRLGLGIGENCNSYMGEKKTLYICGVIHKEYGFYYSTDEGSTWVRVNNEYQMYGDINSVDGDSRTFGRFFIATGSRGVLYGQPKEML